MPPLSAMPGAMTENGRLRGYLRPRMLNGLNSKGQAMTESWLAKKWPQLLEAHYALATPGRGIVICDAEYMIQNRLARITVAKAFTPEPRELGKAEVDSIQAWLDTRDCAPGAICMEALHTTERSVVNAIAHTAEHIDAGLATLRDDIRDDTRGLMAAVLRPAYPVDASVEERIMHNKNSKELLNQESRLLLQEKHLVKHAKKALLNSEDETPGEREARKMITAGLAMLEQCMLEKRARKIKKEPELSKYTGSVMRSNMQHFRDFTLPEPESESESDSLTIVSEKPVTIESPKKKWRRSRPEEVATRVQPTSPLSEPEE